MINIEIVIWFYVTKSLLWGVSLRSLPEQCELISKILIVSNLSTYPLTMYCKKLYSSIIKIFNGFALL